jgi:hypothetical protein
MGGTLMFGWWALKRLVALWRSDKHLLDED